MVVASYKLRESKIGSRLTNPNHVKNWVIGSANEDVYQVGDVFNKF